MRNGFLVGICLVFLAMFSAAGVYAADAGSGKYAKYYQTLRSGGLLGQAHGAAGLDCNTCHKDLKKISKSELNDALCQGCHDINEVNKKVVFKHHGKDVTPHKQHVGDVACVDCHSMHDKSRISCQECHNQPWMKNLSSRWKVKQ